MDSAAALIIAEGLIANNVLEELILNGNSVGDNGARHLMNALKANTSLQYLGLQVRGLKKNKKVGRNDIRGWRMLCVKQYKNLYPWPPAFPSLSPAFIRAPTCPLAHVPTRALPTSTL